MKEAVEGSRKKCLYGDFFIRIRFHAPDCVTVYRIETQGSLCRLNGGRGFGFNG